jgi:hypothetical protein
MVAKIRHTLATGGPVSEVGPNRRDPARNATRPNVGHILRSPEILEIPGIFFATAIDVSKNAWLMCVNTKTIPFFKPYGEPKMNDTTNTPTTEAIREQLRRLEWMIPDAKRRLAKAADQMLWRAQKAVEDSKAMLADEGCTLNWMEFAEGDLREAKEAKAELTKLYEQQRLLTFFLNQK